MYASRPLLVLALCLIGCDSAPPAVDGGGMDAAIADSGSDAGVDAGPPWSGPGCNPTDGIECDGDWTDRCDPGCAATECCAPVGGSFSCVARTEDGACPAANIWVDADRIADAVEWRYFPEDDCAIAEGCVAAPGWRRLLRFSTWTPNTGDADLFLGVPDDSVPYFVYSECHMHYHFNGYAEYELRAGDGSVAATGHKQAFCLLDFYRYPEEDERGVVYDCDNQGIQTGFQDVYGSDLDCQWVDVTDVTPGDYTLHIELNTAHALLESNYDDNSTDVTVTIPEDVVMDVTAPCDRPRTGPDRDCGWTRESMRTCTPGATMTVGCSAACGAGLCTGDTVMRICPTDDPTECNARDAIAVNDESGCTDADSCSQTVFTCPDSGSYVVLTGHYDTAFPDSTCTVAAFSSGP
ncbi:MAG: hypothetical protein H6719_29115 [Sandaracinaceae bacterium]|nr:hypothetical protein [Sandaracinaceae bacterium]